MNHKILLPPAMSLYVTYRCQLACRHCFLTISGALNRHELLFAEISSVIDQARAHGVFVLSLSGGDPLLHPQIFHILERIRASGMMAVMGITGVDIDPITAKRIKNAGVPCVQVSLDGATETANSRYRGPAVFASVLSSIETLKAARINVNLAICIDRDNVHQLRSLLDLGARYGVYRVKVALWEPLPRKPQGSVPALADRSLDTAARQEVLALCGDVNRKRGHNWISVPGYDLEVGCRWRGGKYPPLVVGADGLMRTEELGTPIGDIKKGGIAEQYATFVETCKRRFTERLVAELAQRFNIWKIEQVPSTSPMPAAALTYEFGGRIHILYKEKLTLAVRLFALIHEIGHVARGSLARDPSSHRHLAEESAVNLWALECLQPHLSRSFYRRALELAQRDEDLLYRHIDAALWSNLTDYWEDSWNDSGISDRSPSCGTR